MRRSTLALFLGGTLAVAPTLARGRPFASSHYALEIEGAFAGYVGVGDPMTAQAYDLTLYAPYGASGALDWVSDALEGPTTQKNAAVTIADFNYVIQGRRPLNDALVTEIGFPALDAVSNEGVYLTVELAGDFPPAASASGHLAPPPTGLEGWQSDRFQLEIEGLPCALVSAVDPFLVKRTAAGPKPSHFVFYLPPGAAQPFYQWKASGPTAPPKPGALRYLGSSSQVLTTLRLSELTPVSVGADQGSNPPRVRVELAPKTARLETGQ